eukprot:GEMP01011624.1.p1 GENE.GEMP01011624.1~~GEMP01011624.1.p1  ORF type:complete len:577 (+),score=100.54 GEMP01011624.1:323-2053(+)
MFSLRNDTSVPHNRAPTGVSTRQIANFDQVLPAQTNPLLRVSFPKKTLRPTFSTASTSSACTPSIQPAKLVPFVPSVLATARAASFGTPTSLTRSNTPASAPQQRIAAQVNFVSAAHCMAFNPATISANAARLRISWPPLRPTLAPLRTTTSLLRIEKSERATLGSIAASQARLSSHVIIPENVMERPFSSAHHDRRNTEEIVPNNDAKIESTYRGGEQNVIVPADANAPPNIDHIGVPTVDDKHDASITRKVDEEVCRRFPESSAETTGLRFASTIWNNDDRLAGDTPDYRHSISAALEHEEREHEENTENQFLPVEPFTVDDTRTAIRKSEVGWGLFVNDHVYTWHPGIDLLNPANNETHLLASMPPFRRAPVPKNVVVYVPSIFATLNDRVQCAVERELASTEDQCADTQTMVPLSSAAKGLIVRENTMKQNAQPLPSSRSSGSGDRRASLKLDKTVSRTSKRRFRRICSDSGSIYDGFSANPLSGSTSCSIGEMPGRQTVSWARVLPRSSSMGYFEQGVVHTYMGGSTCLPAALTRGDDESTLWGIGKQQAEGGKKTQSFSDSITPTLGVAH